MKPILIVVASLMAIAAFARDVPEPSGTKKPIGRAELYWLMNRACWYGDDIGVRMLLDAGADPDGVKDYAEFRRFEPSWPINQASWGGHVEVVELLLKAGAKVDLPEGEGHTALTIASFRNHPKLVGVLLAAGADLSYRTPQGTALELAKKKGFTEVVRVLESHKKSK